MVLEASFLVNQELDVKLSASYSPSLSGWHGDSYSPLGTLFSEIF